MFQQEKAHRRVPPPSYRYTMPHSLDSFRPANTNYKIAQFRSSFETFAIIHLEFFQGDYLFYEGDFKITFGSTMGDSSIVNLNVPSPNNDYNIAIVPDSNVVYNEFDGSVNESVMSLIIKSSKKSTFVVRWSLKLGNIDIYFAKAAPTTTSTPNIPTKFVQGTAADGSGLSLHWYIYDKYIIGYFTGKTTERTLRTINIPIHPASAWRTYAIVKGTQFVRTDFNTNGNVEIDLTQISGADEVSVSGNFIVPRYEWSM